MKRGLSFLAVLWFVASCGREPAPTPDLVATQVAVMQAAAATLTAGAPAATPTSAPTATSTASTLPIATETQTLPLPPTPTARPAVTEPPPPPIGPILGRFAVVNVASDDVLNVRARPGVALAIVGSIPYHGLDVVVHAGGQEVSNSWWVPVRWRDVEGWVNSSYLARQVGWVDEAVAARAAQAIMALKERDLQRLAALAHPEKGVRFSPYTYVQVGPDAYGGEDLVFGSAQLPRLLADSTVYHWGVYDGSGEPIDLSFQEYYDRFVYGVDFARPDVVGLDEAVGWSSMINNIAEVYPEAVTVEYHFEGFESQYAGMDWQSLRLVLEEEGGVWYLVGIVHDEWTV